MSRTKREVRYEVRWDVSHLQDIYDLEKDYAVLLRTRTDFGARWWIRTRIPKERRDRYQVVQVTKVEL
jgi:hypothetical protein